MEKAVERTCVEINSCSHVRGVRGHRADAADSVIAASVTSRFDFRAAALATTGRRERSVVILHRLRCGYADDRDGETSHFFRGRARISSRKRATSK